MKVFTQSARLRRLNKLKEKLVRALSCLEIDIAHASHAELDDFLGEYFAAGVTKENVMNLDWRVWEGSRSEQYEEVKDFFAEQAGVYEAGSHRCGYAKKAVRQVSLGVAFLKDESFFDQLGILDFLPLVKADDHGRKIVSVLNDALGSVDIWIDFTNSTRVLLKTKKYQAGGPVLNEQVFPNILAALHNVFETVESKGFVLGCRSAEERRMEKRQAVLAADYQLDAFAVVDAPVDPVAFVRKEEVVSQPNVKVGDDGVLRPIEGVPPPPATTIVTSAQPEATPPAPLGAGTATTPPAVEAAPPVPVVGVTETVPKVDPPIPSQEYKPLSEFLKELKPDSTPTSVV